MCVCVCANIYIYIHNHIYLYIIHTISILLSRILLQSEEWVSRLPAFSSALSQNMMVCISHNEINGLPNPKSYSHPIISKLSHCIVVFALISLHIIPQFGRIISESQTIINFIKVEYIQHCVIVIFISFFSGKYKKRLNPTRPKPENPCCFPPFQLPRSDPRLQGSCASWVEMLRNWKAKVPRKTEFSSSKERRGKTQERWVSMGYNKTPI